LFLIPVYPGINNLVTGRFLVELNTPVVKCQARAPADLWRKESVLTCVALQQAEKEKALKNSAYFFNVRNKIKATGCFLSSYYLLSINNKLVYSLYPSQLLSHLN